MISFGSDTSTQGDHTPLQGLAPALMRILFHPDYDRRLWHWTRSADTPEKGPLAGLWTDHLPPVGNFTPP